MSDSTNERKLDHIRIIGDDADVDRQKRYFDRIHLRHRALPELNLRDVDPSFHFLGKKLSFPLLISSMTGGDHDMVLGVNQRLAEAAQHCGVAMAVGSQRVMFTHPSSRDSFALRERAPDALLFANLGAVQLNYGFGMDEAREAVEVLGADGLYLHLNPLQEAVQPEGDTNFQGLAARMGELQRALDVPVLVKEVGSGLHADDVEMLMGQGIRIFDVAGSGGTSWSRIEHYRRSVDQQDEIGLLFEDWGIPTPLALQLLVRQRERGAQLIASGGVRSALDMVKACVLGAGLVGMASPLLTPALESTEAVIRKVEELRHAFITAMWLMGISKVSELIGNDDLLLEL